MINIEKITSKELLTDVQLNRVDLVVLHRGNNAVTLRCIEHLVNNSDWPYKITLLETSDYHKGLTAHMYTKMIQESTCEHVCFVCSDAFVPNGWLRKIMEAKLKIEESGIKVGAIAPKVLPVVNEIIDRIEGHQVVNVPGGAMCVVVGLYSKKAVTDVGYFDKRFYLYGHDHDMLVRLNKAGYQHYIVGAVSVDHIGGNTTKTLFTKEELDEVNENTKRVYTLKNY